MVEEWLIDGYNLIHAAAGKKAKKPAREAWFQTLAGFAASGQRRVTMVLDGIGDDLEFAAYRTKSFNVIHAQEISADGYIERALYEGRGSKRFVVVTRDRAISNIARGGGAQVLEPEAFLRLLTEDSKERADELFSRSVKSRKFNRPFEDKL